MAIFVNTWQRNGSSRQIFSEATNCNSLSYSARIFGFHQDDSEKRGGFIIHILSNGTKSSGFKRCKAFHLFERSNRVYGRIQYNDFCYMDMSFTTLQLQLQTPVYRYMWQTISPLAFRTLTSKERGSPFLEFCIKQGQASDEFCGCIFVLSTRKHSLDKARDDLQIN